MYRFVSDTFAIAPAMTAPDIVAAGEAGFAMVVNNRFDGESPDQLPTAEVGKLVQAQGMGYRHIPLFAHPDPAPDIAALEEVISTSTGPVIAFCLSGKRSAVLWALTMASRNASPTAEILAATQGAGYDLSPLTPQLETLRQA